MNELFRTTKIRHKEPLCIQDVKELHPIEVYTQDGRKLTRDSSVGRAEDCSWL